MSCTRTPSRPARLVRLAVGLSLSFVLALGVLSPAHAQWISQGEDLLHGWILQSQLTGSESPARVPDGAGGVISIASLAPFTGSGLGDVAASHVTAAGVTDWTSCSICTPTVRFLTRQINPPYNVYYETSVTKDVDGYTFFAWYGNGAVSAQVMSAGGFPQWSNPGGVPVMPVSTIGGRTTICSDFGGGAYVGILDQSNPTIVHVDPQGGVWPGFPVTAIAPPGSTLAGEMQVVAKPDGNCYAFWTDEQGLFLQQINQYGNRDLGNSGVPVCTYANCLPNQLCAVPTASEGAYLAWTDHRSGGNEVYVQQIDSAGDPVWTADGVLVGAGLNPSIAFDPVHQDLLVGWVDPVQYLGFVARFGPAGTVVQAPTIVTNAEDVSVGADPAGGLLVATATTGGLLMVQAYEADGTMRFYNYVSGGTPWHPFIATDNAGGAVVTWSDQATDVFYGLRFMSNGGNAALFPDLTEVADEPSDEGGNVVLTIAAPPADYAPYADTESIYGYGVWRQESASAAVLSKGAPLVKNAELADRLAAGEVSLSPDEAVALGMPAGTWVSVGFHAPLHGPTTYSFLAPTRTDSTSAGPAVETFAVTSHTVSGIVTTSLSRSGSSVDNLAPAAPANLVGQLTGGAVDLTWSPVAAADLASYAVYRGDTVDFAPSAANRLGQPTAAAYSDPLFVPGAWYKVSAVDRHGNESAFATLAPAQVTAVGGLDTHVSFLGQPHPSPGSAPGTVVYGLAATGYVSLVVYDQQGRRVRELVAAMETAGPHQATWDGRDEAGRRVASGIYYFRLAAGNFQETHKMVLLK